MSWAHSLPWWTAPLFPLACYGLILLHVLLQPRKLGRCTGCSRYACRMVGRGFARRREHAYCADCMPELYE